MSCSLNKLHESRKNYNQPKTSSFWNNKESDVTQMELLAGVLVNMTIIYVTIKSKTSI